jgi:SHS family lactate transporter-like MFS transporter
MAAAFFQQFCTQGAWSVIPIYINELSPGSLRLSCFVQLIKWAILLRSPHPELRKSLVSATHFHHSRTQNETIPERYNYGKVVCISMGPLHAHNVLIIHVGPTDRGNDSSNVKHDAEMTEATIKAQRRNKNQFRGG